MKTFAHNPYLRMAHKTVACLLTFLMVNLPIWAISGADPVTGVGGIAVVGNSADVLLNADRAILNWKDLDTDLGDHLTFEYGSNFAVLNRVADQVIFNGQLNAVNGHVFIMSANGVIIGSTADLNAAKFTASGLNLSNSDFLADNYHFVPFKKGAIGNVMVENGADFTGVTEMVTLLGKTVLNEADITGSDIVVMASGDDILITQEGSHIAVMIEAPKKGDADDYAVNHADGSISAEHVTFAAAGDIWASAAIIANDSGTGSSITLEADRHINIDAPLSTEGNMNLFADASGNVVGDMISSDGAALNADGNIDIKGNNVVLGDAVTAGEDLTITGRDCEPVDDEYEWGNVWAKKTLNAGGDIIISATGKEGTWISGHWDGGYWVDGHFEGSGWYRHWVPGHMEGQTWIEGYNEYSYFPGTITLDGNVTANGDIKLYNDTYTTNVTGNGVTLRAGDDIEFLNDNTNPLENAAFIEGQHYLALIAGDKIKAPSTQIGVTGSTLLMQQNPTLDTAAFAFFNQNTTDVILISNSGSVISTMTNSNNAADEWKSIGATARDNIDLEGNDGITLGSSGTDAGLSLWARHGDVDVNAGYNVLATKDIKAGDDIRIYANHGILLQAAEAGDNMTVKADVDKYWGENVVVNGTLEAGDDMMLEGSNVTLNNSAEAGGTMNILAHGLYSLDGSAPGSLVAGGDVDINGDLHAGGDIDIKATVYGHGGSTTGPGFNGNTVPYRADGTIYLADDVTTDSGHITFHNNVVADGTGSKRDQTFDAGGDYKDLTAKGDIIKVTDGDLTLDAGRDPGAHIYLAGDVKTHDGDLKFEDDVIANGHGDQTFDAGGYGSDLIAKDDISKVTDGDLTLDASNHTIYLAGDVTTSNGDLNFNAPVIANGYGDQTFDAGGDYKDLTVKGDIIKVTDGDFTLDAGRDPGAHIYLAGDVTTHDGDLKFEDDVIANGHGDQTFDAGGYGSDLIAKDDISKVTDGDLTLDASNHTIYLAGDVTTSNGDLNFNAPVIANGFSDQSFNADGYGNKLIAMSSITKPTNGSLTLDGGHNAGYEIELNGDVTVNNGTLYIGENNTYDDETTVAAGKTLESKNGDVRIASDINGEGDLTIKAGDDLRVYGNVDAAGGLAMNSGTVSGVESEMLLNGDVTAESMVLRAGTGTIDGFRRDTIEIYGNVESTLGDLEIISDDHIYVQGNVTSAQNIEIIGNSDAAQGGLIGVVDLDGNVSAIDNIIIDAGKDSIYLEQNVESAKGNIDINTGAALDGLDTQAIEASEGRVTANGFLNKIYSGELHISGGEEDLAVDIAGTVKAIDNIYIVGLGDIQLSDNVTAGEDCIRCELENNDDFIILRAQVYERQKEDGQCCGGVFILSEDGKVYTAEAGGLSVTIRGYSDTEGHGVNLSGIPGDEESGKAAIVIISKEDLILDEGATLEAYGFYDTTGAVDDRPDMDLLDEDADIPFPGQFPREQGDAFDVAIYLRSSGTNAEPDQGNVVVNAAVSIQSFDGEVCTNEGAMVIDAWDTVEFGSNFETSLLGDGTTSNVGNRLEVISRDTEWLEDAFGRLPFAEEWAFPNTGPNPPFPAGYNYVLRGAGLENPDIEDGRAWVLEPEMLPVAPLPLMELPKLAGCPVQMDAAAAELGINSDALQLQIAQAMAANPNLQPCDACQSLLTSAAALQDADGARMAALNQIFNTLAPADAPFTPEVQASVATAFADMAGEDLQYALAAEYVDAFVNYVAVIENDLQSPVGDPVALVLEKYGQNVTGDDNPNVAAYIMAQLAGGSL